MMNSLFHSNQLLKHLVTSTFEPTNTVLVLFQSVLFQSVLFPQHLSQPVTRTSLHRSNMSGRICCIMLQYSNEEPFTLMIPS